MLSNGIKVWLIVKVVDQKAKKLNEVEKVMKIRINTLLLLIIL